MKQKLTIRKDTKSYSPNDVLKEIGECKEIIADIGCKEILNNKYMVKFSDNMSKCLGQCTKLKPNVYEIKINKPYLKSASSEDIHNTIMHEVIHSAPQCMNHGPHWKAIANRVNAKYEYSPIQRTSKVTGYTPNYKYAIVCDKCGAKSLFTRNCQAVKMAKKNCGLICTKCKGKSFTVEEL